MAVPTYNVVMKYNKPLGLGPAQHAGSTGTVGPLGNANASGGLQFYTAKYTSFGKANPFNLVGSDPSLGVAATTIGNGFLGVVDPSFFDERLNALVPTFAPNHNYPFS